MWAFLGSECLLFGALISTYLLYRGRALQGPTPHDVYDIPFTSVSSFVLLMSSLTMVLALAAIQRGDHHSTRVWLLATALLGMTFVSGQIYEFTIFVREGFTVRSSPAGSAFFILTSFHGALATAIEISLYYLKMPHGLFIGLLLFFMIIKFSLVVAYFMHLKFDARIFRRLMVTGLSLAIAVYMIVLATFGLFR